MSCLSLIAKNIVNSCETVPRSGYESVAWALNLGEFDYSINKNLVTSIEMNAGKYAYHVTAVKKEMNGGFDAIIGDGEDRFIHDFSFKPHERDPGSIVNIDDMNGIVIIAELKGEKTEGCFIILGLQTGLYKNTGGLRVNDNYGIPDYNFSSIDSIGEKYSRFVLWDTDYTTTKDLIEALTEEVILATEDDFGLTTESGDILILE